jgi:hypothetical protein
MLGRVQVRHDSVRIMIIYSGGGEMLTHLIHRYIYEENMSKLNSQSGNFNLSGVYVKCLKLQGTKKLFAWLLNAIQSQ